jgi:HEPN domain-containing protein
MKLMTQNRQYSSCNVNIEEMSIANNLETLRYFKSELMFLAEIAHKTNRHELVLSHCQEALELCLLILLIKKFGFNTTE